MTFSTPHVFGEYVLTSSKNAFNNKRSWWLSKKGIGKAVYCFSTSGSDVSQKNEANEHIKNIDSYIKMFENEFDVEKLIIWLTEYQEDNNTALGCSCDDNYTRGSIDTIDNVLQKIKSMKAGN